MRQFAAFFYDCLSLVRDHSYDYSAFQIDGNHAFLVLRYLATGDFCGVALNVELGTVGELGEVEKEYFGVTGTSDHQIVYDVVGLHFLLVA